MSKCWNTHVSMHGCTYHYGYIDLIYFLQICMMSSNDTLALGNMGTEKIYIDSSSGEVFIQYTGHAEM